MDFTSILHGMNNQPNALANTMGNPMMQQMNPAMMQQGMPQGMQQMDPSMMMQQGMPQGMPQGMQMDPSMMQQQMDPHMMQQMGPMMMGKSQQGNQDVDALHIEYLVPQNKNLNINNYGISYEQLVNGSQHNGISDKFNQGAGIQNQMKNMKLN